MLTLDANESYECIRNEPRELASMHGTELRPGDYVLTNWGRNEGDAYLSPTTADWLTFARVDSIGDGVVRVCEGPTTQQAQS